MTSKQKKFILKKLIPFILRERGRGFIMEGWREPFDADAEYDGIPRKAPSCGTAYCIGGSIELLKRKKDHIGFNAAGFLIGLNEEQSNRLFSEDILWPHKYSAKWYAATTPLAKAKAAVALLREVVKTDGKVLDY